MGTTELEASRRIALGLVLALVFLLGPAAVEAEATTCPDSTCELAQRAREDDETLLDKVGLGSLRDVAWEAFPVALGLSALIGAAGGFVYAGLSKGSRPDKRRPDEKGSDRPSS